MRLISVILNAKTDEARASTSTALLNYVFRFYDSHLIYPAGSTITKSRIWFGEDKTLPAGLKQNLYVTTPIGKFGQVKTTILPQPDIKAPIQKGQSIGVVTVTLNDEVIDKAPLLNGKIKIKKSRFFDIYTNLYLTLPDETAKNTVDTQTLVPLRSYLLNQHQRTRSDQLNYLDHPLFGILIKISEFKPRGILPTLEPGPVILDDQVTTSNASNT